MKKIITALFLLCCATNNTQIFSMENNAQSLWTPKNVIGVAWALASLKLTYDGIQQMCNFSQSTAPLNHSTFFDLNLGTKQGGNITSTFPNVQQLPNTINIGIKKLKPEERKRKFAFGFLKTSLGAANFAGSIYFTLKS